MIPGTVGARHPRPKPNEKICCIDDRGLEHDRTKFLLVSRIFRALDLRFLKPLHRAVRFLSSEPPRIIHDTNKFLFLKMGDDLRSVSDDHLRSVSDHRRGGAFFG